tara:strand:+ start:981 stop:1262 length:282 start_codon:yes stop_codon:yes gene_type:complete
MSENRKTKQQLTDNDPSDRDLALVRYKNRKERRGRPRKWMPGDRVRLQTTITPQTHELLHRIATEQHCCTGVIIDRMLKPEPREQNEPLHIKI